MSPSTPSRPPQVTMAGWMIVVGSVLVVVTVFEMLAGLRSLETREAVETFLADPPGDALGWSVETVLQVLRTTAMVTAGCATAAAVLGWHALRRNRGARVGLTVLALPLFATGVVTGGFVASLVAAASLMLWLQPARDWFNGKQWTPPARAGGGERRGHDVDGPPPGWPPLPPGHGTGGTSGPDHAAPPVAGPPAAPPGPGAPSGDPHGDVPQGPRPVQGFGDRPSYVTPGHGPAGASPAFPSARVPGAHASTGRSSGRPDVVLVAALLTWLFAGFAFLSATLSLAVVTSSPDYFFDELERTQPGARADLAAQGMPEEALLAGLQVFCVVLAVWSLAALVAAAFVMRRASWAHTLLLVLAAGSVVASFVGAVVNLALALPALASVTVFVLLRRPDVRAWIRGR